MIHQNDDEMLPLKVRLLERLFNGKDSKLQVLNRNVVHLIPTYCSY